MQNSASAIANALSISIRYQALPETNNRVYAFAADLQKQLMLARLNVVVPNPPSECADATPIVGERVKDILWNTAKLPIPQAFFTEQAPSSPAHIFVDAELFDRKHNILVPARERSIFARRTGAIMITFGKDSSTFSALPLAAALAKRLVLPLLFYHTTWKDPSVTDAAPEAHMCDDAREIMTQLVAFATNEGIKYTVVIETADGVAEGITQCALRNNVVLIAMSEDPNIDKGCYVSDVIRQCPIPVLYTPSYCSMENR